LASQDQNWAILILDQLINDKEDIVIDKAGQAKERVEKNIRNK